MKDERTILALIDAILFAAGDAVPEERLAVLVDELPENVAAVIRAESARREEEGAGLLLRRVDRSWQLCTNPEYRDTVVKLAGERPMQTLSNPMLETLAIIAYRQPVTRLDVDQLRGVNSSYTINALEEKGLIRDVGFKETVGHPRLYGTTEEFLRRFGISDLADLPEMETFGGSLETEAVAPTQEEGDALP